MAIIDMFANQLAYGVYILLLIDNTNDVTPTSLDNLEL